MICVTLGSCRSPFKEMCTTGTVIMIICAERAKRAKRVCIFDGLRLLVGAVLVVVVGWLVGSIFSEKAETVQNTAD